MLFVASVGAFLWLTLVGGAALAICFDRLTARTALLAPAIGTAICLVVLMTATRAGFSIGVAAWPIASGLTVGALAVIAWRRWRFRDMERAQITNAAVGFGICVVSMLISGWPMILYGKNWVSYANDDMVNYCLSAMRFLEASYFQLPNAADVIAGRNIPATYFLFHILARERVGADLCLAFLSRILGLIPFSAFMPMMLILHACLIAAVGALCVNSNLARIFGMGAMSLSALETLGVEYQLLGQECGVSLLIATAALLAIIVAEESDWRLAALAGVMTSGILLAYPEVFAFLLVAFILFAVRYTMFRSANFVSILRPLIIQLGIASGVALVLVNGQVFQVLALLIERQRTIESSTSSAVNVVLFPYYLLPSGVANLFGLLPIGFSTESTLLQVGIALGFIALLAVFVLMIVGIRRGEMSAYLLLVMAILAIPLFHAREGFPLYKLAMYMQAPMIVTWANAAIRMRVPSLGRLLSRARTAAT